MKVIVISGGSSNVGKTTLARNLQGVLARSHVVKIGHGRRKPDIGNHFYESGTPFSVIRANHREARWLLIESNSILREIQPDLVIYLEGEHSKPSAEHARCRADIVSGRLVRGDIPALAARLGITVDLMQTILRLAGGGSDEPKPKGPA